MDGLSVTAHPERGGLCVRMVAGAGERAALMALRRWRFRAGLRDDEDRFDAGCDHYVIEDTDSGAALGGFRVRLSTGAGLAGGYSAQFYDLSRMNGYHRPVLELGRLCLWPGPRDADVLRLAWAAIARRVDVSGAGMLVGCTSFPGFDPSPCANAFALLRDRHPPDPARRPGIRAPDVVRFADLPALRDPAGARAALPTLLRSYLGLGAWVSDHAVIDRDLSSLHVFTALDIARVPPARARLLRALAG